MRRLGPQGQRKDTGPLSPQIIYLRRFKALRTLSLSGNPVAENEDYKMFICAYLPDLVYLDFRRLDDHMVASPLDVGSMGQSPGPGHLGRATSTGGEESSPSWRLLTLTAPVTVVHAFSQALSWASSHLLAAILLSASLQPTPQAVHPPRQLQPSLTASFTYKDKFVIICLNIFEYGLKQQEKRKAELETFMECVQEAIKENQEQGKLKIAKFEEKHLLVGPAPSPPPAVGAHLPEAQPLPSDDPSPLVIVPVHQFTSSGFYLPHPLRLLHCPRLTVGSPRPFASVVSLPRFLPKARFCLQSLNAIREESELSNIETKIVEHSEDITALLNVLMTLEMQLVEQLESMLQVLGPGVGDLYADATDKSPGRTSWASPREGAPACLARPWLNSGCTMAQCRDLENHHHEKLLEIAINILEKIVKGEMDEDLPDDLRSLFIDKDTIVNAVGASHDIHLLKIDNREDELVTRVQSWCTHLLDKIHKDEIMRNRKRVKEINQYIDHVQSELDSLEYGDLLD
ncbi:hypothetical protein Celaphus_00001105 [Cervus elaphus hippelaphus]|uniref:LRRC48 n=1 Tax=Cervus elaphus hippelaphus TaxID=46360 RepID=A0A212D8H0_CEREH|nr:hypothetical protein Celaphus_00001105 [Cervus elaphus hippelaphus]